MAGAVASSPIIGETSEVAVADLANSLPSADKEATPTPPTHRFSFSATILKYVPRPLHERVGSYPGPLISLYPSIDLFDLSDLNKLYAEETKAKHEAIMAQLNSSHDVFDSVSWDPDLASLSPPDKSPEPVPIKPQPIAIAYTTVGSVVNPRAAPQFSAPNRIQREGAQRKSLMSILQSYDANTLNSPRGPPPPLNMANSMQYAQQLSRNTSQSSNVHQTVTNRTPRPTSSNLPDIDSMSDDDLRILIYSLGHRLLSEDDAPLSSNVKGMAEEELAARSGNSSGPIQGLEKMQTVQRLSKFPNPMQKVAQSKLSEFSVARTQQLANRTIAVPDIGGLRIAEKTTAISKTSKPPYLAMPKPGAGLGDIARAKVLRNIDAAGGLAAYLAPYNGSLLDQRAAMFDNRLRSQGELDRGFQFPPPGLMGPSTAQANPLYGAYGSSSQTASVPTRPPGYPQPLTAGPPGQRPYPAGASFASSAAGTEELWSSEYTADACNPLLNDLSFNLSTTSPWSNNITPAGQNFPTLPEISSTPGFDYGATSKLVDTLSPQDALNYYPNGFPPDMTGHWTPPSEESLRKFGELPPLTDEDKEAKRLEAVDDNFYYGVRRMASMTPADYNAEYHARQINPHGPIARPPKVKLPKKSVEEWNNMTEVESAEAMKPLLNVAYGTLVAYLDHTPGSRYSLSQFRKAGEELIDRSKNGNKSYFGEDWGAPPKNPSIGVASQPAPQNARAHHDNPNPNSASQILAAKHMQQR